MTNDGNDHSPRPGLEGLTPAPVSRDTIHVLERVGAGEADRRWEVTRRPIVIGRGEAAEVVVGDDDVAERHCAVRVADEGLVVTDLGAAAGTFIGAARVRGSADLPAGSELGVGPARFTVVRAARQHVEGLDRRTDELNRAAAAVHARLPPRLVVGPLRTDWTLAPSPVLGGASFGHTMFEEGHFALYLLDVVGTGPDAARHAVTVASVLRQQALPSTDFTQPEQVLAGLERRFRSGLTIWYGVYDATTRRLVYASAGDTPALLRARGGDVERLHTHEEGLRGSGEARFAHAGTDVPSGARLYGFAGGVRGVVTGAGAPLAVADLQRVLQDAGPLRGEAARVERAVRGVARHDLLEDGLALLVVEFPEWTSP